MKIAILTFHRAHNCGAMLQCFALQTVLSRLGHDVCALDCNNIGEEHRFGGIGKCSFRRMIKKILEFFFSLGVYDLRIVRFNKFRRNHIKVSGRIGLNEIFPKDYDLFIIGSDQVLQPNLTKEYRDTFLLNRVLDSAKKCSYAASFGYDSLPVQYRESYRKALGSFKSLLVREKSGLDILENELKINRKAHLVVDPTLLLNAEDYERIETAMRRPKQYVLVYSIGGADQRLREVAKQLARIKGIGVVIVNACRRHYFDAPFSDFLSVSPDRLIYLIHHAEYVVTTSFHGVAFSLIYRRPFVAIDPVDSKVGGRIHSLLEQLGLKGNIIKECARISDEELMEILAFDYKTVSKSLEDIKGVSLSTIKKSLL